MNLYNYIKSDKNIYLAIYSLRSYIYNENLLSAEDLILYKKLLDPFNEDVISEVIKNVREIIERIIEDDDFYFNVQVYFIPKSYDPGKDEMVFRPIHTADLKQLIAMVSLFQVIIYEIPREENNYKINLSNYSRLIPQNFYGNKISTKVEEIYINWNIQYPKFVEKTNQFFKEGYKFGKYKYEVKLDLVDFFPSINPILIYQLLIENMPATLLDKKDIDVFKKTIYKLTNCKITNLRNPSVRERYYKNKSKKINKCYNFTKGLPQGLPQSYFFGNICMIEISKIINRILGVNSLYYVDDTYVYTNTEIIDKNRFKLYLETINKNILKMETACKKKYLLNNDISRINYIHRRFERDQLQSLYNIKVHPEGKSEYTEIKTITEDKYNVRNLKRQVSQVGCDIKRIYSEKEEEILLHNIEALVCAIEAAIKSNGKITDANKKKLISYYKFFKYRLIMLKLRTNSYSKQELFRILIDQKAGEENLNYDGLSDIGICKAELFDRFQNDIWLSAVRMLIENTIFEHKSIKIYLENIINNVYKEEMKSCSYIYQYFKNYIENEYINYQMLKNEDKYCSLKLKCNSLFKYYSDLNNDGLNAIFSGTKINDMDCNILESFNVCSKQFLDMSIIVQNNSNELQRMFLNAVYSSIFKVMISDDLVLNSYSRKGITYGVLRCLVYLRNKRCKIEDFLNWSINIYSSENAQIIDYSIINVLDIFRIYVKEPQYIDCLILVHKYTSDIWKNGAKHLYFYTLHNQEHSVELIKNCILLGKVFKNLNVSSYNYYILFISCYLHDISMVKIADEKDFLIENEKTKEIVDILNSYNEIKTDSDKKKLIIKIYKEVDEYYESVIRNRHAGNSANEIRKRVELSFLDPSVRENVANIAKAHVYDAEKVYITDSKIKKGLIDYTNDKILLRLADLMDMCQNRVTKIILNHNFSNISQKSAFHWISHFLTQNCVLSADYKTVEDDKIKGGQNKLHFEETVKFTIYVNFSQFSKRPCMKCEFGKLDDSSLNEQGFKIIMLEKNEKCESKNCNFLCRWFNIKNNYLVKEMQALENYLSKIQSCRNIYNIKIEIQVAIVNSTNISDLEFQILKNEVEKN